MPSISRVILIYFLTAALGAGLFPLAAQSGGPIPGVDDIPAAEDPEKRKLPINKEFLDPTKKEPEKKEPGKKEPEKKKSSEGGTKNIAVEELPLIKGVKVVSHPKFPNSALVTWKVSEKNKGPIYVGRYLTPLTARNLVLQADNLTVPALGNKETSFSDINIPDGTYYYVVVSHDEMLKGSKLVLRPEENYTAKGFVIKRKDQPPPRTLPRIGELVARVHPELKNSVLITWKFKGPVRDVFIKRYKKPLNKRKLLGEAFSVKEPAKEPAKGEFIDKNLKPGVYYYAVYTREEYKGKLVLKPDENYTVIPVVIKAPEKKSKFDPLLYTVSDLSAINSGKIVKLSWSPALSDKQILYTVYRSRFPLDKMEAFSKAKRLGIVAQNVNNFKDKNPPAGKPVFYGVTVTHQKSSEEFKPLAENVSYVRHTYELREVGKKEGDLIPNNLILYHKAAGIINLHWTPPQVKTSGFRVYRSKHPIYSKDQLKRATFAGEAPGDKKSYSDEQVPPGRHFYAILPKDGKGANLEIFVEGRTFSGFSVVVRPYQKTDKKVVKKEPPKKKERPRLLSLRISLDGKANVILRWSADHKKRKDFRYLLYRSSKPLRTLKEVNRDGYVLAELPPEANQYRDEKLEPGRYYYALLIRADNALDKTMIAGKHYPRRSVVIQDPRKIVKKEPKKEPVKKPRPSILALRAAREKKDVILSWAADLKKRKDVTFLLYRGAKPLRTPLDLRKRGEIIATLPSFVTKFRDRSLAPGKYYYALVAYADNKADRILERNRHYLARPVIITKEKKVVVKKEPPKKEEPRPVLLSLRASLKKSDVTLRFSADLKKRKDVVIVVYRSAYPLRSSRELRENGAVVARLPGSDRSYRDEELPPGKYYYALVLEAGGKPDPVFFEGRTFLGRPVAILGPVKKQPPGKKVVVGPDPKKVIKKGPVKRPETRTDNRTVRRNINRILRRTYKRRRYVTAIRRLEPYANNRRINGKLRARALFYTGLSYYKLRRYRKALEYFLNFQVQDTYPERARFWRKRALERF